MDIAHGIAVFPGVAIAPAYVLDREGFRIPKYRVAPDQTAGEIARLDTCILALAQQVADQARMVSESLGAEVAQIFEAHRNLIADPHLRAAIVEVIEKECATAERAVQAVLGKYAAFFRDQAGGHFADRASDMVDIERRILTQLLGDRRAHLSKLEHEVIVLARDLTPSETASFNPRQVRGMATETGGLTSHTAIVAGALEIPAVVGLGRLPPIADGDTVIVDGNRGVLIATPDEPTLQLYRSRARELVLAERGLQELRDLPAETRDGVRVRLYGNIEFPHEAAHCLERGADGIGLYRTEFLYLNGDDPPSEEDHYSAYAAVVRAVGPHRPVTFRTLDLGADKLERDRNAKPEPNPFLGLRSIRLSLKNPAVFKTQLRAMLRASTLGDVRIMFPLVSTLRELRRCRMMLSDVMEDLEEEGVPFRRDIPVGMMVEVPSAALLADQFAQHVDFFSIGTNDLIQYTLAVDRTNVAVAPLYNASDPAVLKLVRHVILAARRYGVEVSVCGEMSGDPIYAPLLVGLGLRRLSLTPHSIPEIKRTIRNLTVLEAERLAARVKRLDNASDISKYLRNRLPASAAPAVSGVDR